MINSINIKVFLSVIFINSVYLVIIVFTLKRTNLDLSETQKISGQIEQIGITEKKYRKSGNPFSLNSKVYFVKLKNSHELFSFPFQKKYDSSFTSLKKNQKIQIFHENRKLTENTTDVIQIQSSNVIILSKKNYEFFYYLVLIITSLALILTNYSIYKKTFRK